MQINPEFLDPNNDREFINFINNLDLPDEFDDLEDLLDDIDLIMESLLHPDKIEEHWHISNAKRMWTDFQSHQQHVHQTTVHHNYRTTAQTERVPANITSRVVEGLSLPHNPVTNPKTFL